MRETADMRERILAFLTYDPVTGVFARIKGCHGHIAATRLAIVRAAAETGKNLKEKT
jgi:hypothetical protein